MNDKSDVPHRNLEDFAGIASDWFWESDADHRFTYFSGRIEEVTRISSASMLGKRRNAIGHHHVGDANWEAHFADLDAHRPFRNFEYCIERPSDGSLMWLRVAGHPVFDKDGTFIGYRGTGHDITAEKEAIQRLVTANKALAERNRELDDARLALEYAAYHDPLSDLYNRPAFERDLARALAAENKAVGLIHIDLDRFKWVNDSLGHHVGDAVLVETAKRIKSILPDFGSAYRVGGDEFLIILIQDATTELCTWIGDTIIELMTIPIEHEQQIVKVGASIGVASGQSGHISTEQLIAQAEFSLQEAKTSGRNTVRHLTPQILEAMHLRRSFAAEIPRALEKGEFIPYFQPQVHIGTGAVVGAEALVRWNHPIRGILGPASFLQAAGELGLIPAIDQIMLGETLAATTRLRQQGFMLPSVSVNVSGARLLDQSLIKDIETLWQDRRCKLCVELLETIYYDEVGENSRLYANLKKLRDLGVRIETDDFGSGRASITGLLTVRPDRLKIDRALIQAAVKDPIKRSVVAAIFEMTRALGIEGMAEGVETQEDIASIRALGCNIFQGYAVSHPLTEAELATYLGARHCTTETQTAGQFGLPKSAST